MYFSFAQSSTGSNLFSLPTGRDLKEESLKKKAASVAKVQMFAGSAQNTAHGRRFWALVTLAPWTHLWPRMNHCKCVMFAGSAQMREDLCPCRKRQRYV